MATNSSADYVAENLQSAVVIRTRREVLEYAISISEISSDRLVLEFGVFSGSTINIIASIVRGQVFGFDSFEGLPDRWRAGFERGRFTLNELPTVAQNVTLIKGRFNESLPPFLSDHKHEIGFVHIDCDLYSSTKTILDLISDQVCVGTVLVFDEYFNYPGWKQGEYKAFQEFVSRLDVGYEYLAYNCYHEQVAIRITKLRDR